MIELIRFLLENGVYFILTEKFNQDRLEQNFGTHRSLGGRSNNPTANVWHFSFHVTRFGRH